MKFLQLLILSICLATTSFAQFPDVEMIKIDTANTYARPRILTTVGDKMFFAGNDSVRGVELWYMDKNNKPHFFHEFVPGVTPGIPISDLNQNFTTANKMGVINNNLYFVAHWVDSVAIALRAGLYQVDTGGSTYKVVDSLIKGVADFITYKNKLYMSAMTNQTTGLYCYDPASNATIMLANSSNMVMNEHMALVNDNIYFVANTGVGQTLYEFNITSYSLNIIADTSAANGSFTEIHHPIGVDNKLYFIARTAANGRELYQYKDGNVQMITDLMPGASGGVNNVKPFHHKGMIFFNGNTTKPGYTKTLSAYDTTRKHTITFVNTMGNHTPISPILLDPKEFQEYNGRLCFNATGKQGDIELAVFNLQDSTGIKVDAFGGLLASSYPRLLTPFNGSLYFVAKNFNSPTSIYAYNQLYRYTFFPTSISTTIQQTVSSTLYPNPTSSNATLALEIKTPQTLSITITDIAGRRVHSIPAQQYSTGTHNISLPTAPLSGGSYFYSVIDKSGATLISGKLIKQ